MKTAALMTAIGNKGSAGTAAPGNFSTVSPLRYSRWSGMLNGVDVDPYGKAFNQALQPQVDIADSLSGNQNSILNNHNEYKVRTAQGDPLPIN